ncbi:MAG: phosphotransferase family protein [Halioglobus sp.]|nr:phosphotransferase family protein [Halioglobus sp.]
MAINVAEDVAPVRADEHMDWPSLEHWLKQHIDGLTGPMSVAQFHGGHANLTYCVSFCDYDLVVRRQPHGDIPPGAHDMAREHRVLSALGKAFPPAPASLAYCEDNSVIGAPFVVMERKYGVVIRDHIPAALAVHENVEQRVSMALIDAMAALHSIVPADIGLEKLGRPEGFVSRQLAGWNKRWELACSEEVPLFAEIYQHLLATQPESSHACIVHNDLKLDNCMFAPDNPDQVSAIFDWDMATLGDPLVELGTLLSYWREAGDKLHRAPTIELDMDRFPTRAELVERYARSGIEITHIDWYEAFGHWKHAVVLQQLYRRFATGQTKDSRLGALKPNIAITLGVARAVLSKV